MFLILSYLSNNSDDNVQNPEDGMFYASFWKMMVSFHRKNNGNMGCHWKPSFILTVHNLKIWMMYSL